MEEQNVVIEITDTEIRLVVGYVKNNKPHLMHVATRPINGLISHGEINDFNTLSQILSSLREIKDPNGKEKMVINQVTVILPAIGLTIYESEKTTNVVSDSSIIGQLDIENVVSLVQKEQIPPQNEIIDIVPDEYILDGGRTSTIPPLTQKSDTITLKAKIHTLPSRIVSQYRQVIQSAHLTVNRFCLSSYAGCELAKYIDGIPDTYLLVDMGAEVSSITLVGNNSPYGTIPFEGGGTYIVNKLVEKFGATPEEGLELLTKTGYSKRELSFTPPVYSREVNGELIEYTRENLNEIIKDYFDREFFPKFDNALVALLADYNDELRKLPIVFCGGFSMMIGFKLLAKEKFIYNKSISFLNPNVIGARSGQYVNAIGGLLIASSVKGALSEQRKKSKGLYR